MTEIRKYPDVPALANAAAELFAAFAQKAVETSGKFSVALSGGSTPKALFGLLASPFIANQIDWAHVHLFWGDERCVPPDHADSNYRMTRETLLNHVPMPAANVHRMQGEIEPVQAAEAYEAELSSFFGTVQPRFDLVLLGMGDDGHTASLFPGTAALDEKTQAVTANYVDKLHTWRITLTQTAINNAAAIIFLVAGEAKAGILREVINGPYQPEVYPSQLVEPVDGQLIWLVDEAATSLL